jgi:hypothetical protein
MSSTLISRIDEALGLPQPPTLIERINAALEEGSLDEKLGRGILSRLAAAGIAAAVLAAPMAHAQDVRRAQLVAPSTQSDTILIHSPRPPFPKQALNARIGGTVKIRIKVESGNIVDVKGVSGPPELADPSADWIKQNWDFAPTANGTFTLPLTFAVQGGSGNSPDDLSKTETETGASGTKTTDSKFKTSRTRIR